MWSIVKIMTNLTTGAMFNPPPSWDLVNGFMMRDHKNIYEKPYWAVMWWVFLVIYQFPEYQPPSRIRTPGTYWELDIWLWNKVGCTLGAKIFSEVQGECVAPYFSPSQWEGLLKVKSVQLFLPFSRRHSIGDSLKCLSSIYQFIMNDYDVLGFNHYFVVFSRWKWFRGALEF